MEICVSVLSYVESVLSRDCVRTKKMFYWKIISLYRRF